MSRFRKLKPLLAKVLNRSGLVAALLLATACSQTESAKPTAKEEAGSSRLLIAGSSTIAPFATTAAEYFRATSDFAVPVVESTGTGGGFRLFCQGEGLETSSIATASRRMTESERAICASNGVNDIIEMKFGYDGIVVIYSRAHADLSLTRADLYRALAKEIYIDGELKSNPHKYWSDVRSDLPREKIEVFGPPPTSGTRDAFVKLVMEAGAMSDPDMRALKSSEPDLFIEKSTTIRTDGAWTDSGENDSHIIQSLVQHHKALGVVGYSYLDQSSDRIAAARIDGVAPDFNAIVDGTYPVSRPLFFYVKGAHVGKIPSLVPFIEEAFSEAAMGDGGYLVTKGLIPLNAAERTATRSRFSRAVLADQNKNGQSL